MPTDDHRARVAVVVTCLMENWSGDNGPPFSVQTTSLKAGTHDRAAMTKEIDALLAQNENARVPAEILESLGTEELYAWPKGLKVRK